MLAVFKEEPIKNKITVKETAWPEVSRGELLVRVKATGLCGSDVHAYHWTKDYENRLKNHLPVILGHEFVGEIEEIGDGVERFSLGDTIIAMPGTYCGSCSYCDVGDTAKCMQRKTLGVQINGSMAEYVVVPANCSFIFPEGIPFEVGAMFEPISIALNAVNKADSLLGKDVVIFGPGPLGYFIALFCYLGGAKSIIVRGLPEDEGRMKIFRDSIPGVITVDDADKLGHHIFGGKRNEVDIVFEVSGALESIEKSLEILKKQGTLVLVGLTPDKISLNINNIVRKEINTVGSHGGKKSLWKELVDYMDNMSNEDLNRFQKAAGKKFSLDEAKEAFKAAEKGDGLKTLIVP